MTKVVVATPVQTFILASFLGGTFAFIWLRNRNKESKGDSISEVLSKCTKVKLYGDPVSLCTRKVIQILEERDFSFELEVISLKEKEQKNPDYMSKHPFGKVPYIEISDGFTLYESHAIVQYLDEVLPGKQFTPTLPTDRAVMEKWISIYSSYLKLPQRKIRRERFLKERYGLGPCDEAVVSQAIEELKPVLEVMDAQLAKTHYLAGEEFTLADLLIGPDFSSLVHEKGTEELIAQKENIVRWWNLCKARPAWKKTCQYDKSSSS